MKLRTGRLIQAAIYFGVVAAFLLMAAGVFVPAHSQATLPDTPEAREAAAADARHVACVAGYLNLSSAATRLQELAEAESEQDYYDRVAQETAYAVNLVIEGKLVDVVARLCAERRLGALTTTTASWTKRADALEEARERKRQWEVEALMNELLGREPDQ